MDIKTSNLDKVFQLDNYTIGKFNRLKNDGYIAYNQDPHYDYPPRTTEESITVIIKVSICLSLIFF